MGRLPSRNNEPARTIAVLAEVGAQIRRHLRGGSVARRTDVSLVAIADAWDASHAYESRAVPAYKELQTGYVDASPPALTLTGAAAVSAHPTAAPIPDFFPDFLSDVKHLIEAAHDGKLMLRLRRRGKSAFHWPDRAGCAVILRVNLDWFDRNHQRLISDFSFPAERGGEGQRHWRGMDVATWSVSDIATQILARPRRALLKSLERRS